MHTTHLYIHIHTHTERRGTRLGIRQRWREAAAVYVHKIHFIGFHRLPFSPLLKFILHSPVGFPRCFLPSASMTSRNSNFRLPSLATLRILCVWGIFLVAPCARASHIWHVAREGATYFSTRLLSSGSDYCESSASKNFWTRKFLESEDEILHLANYF